MSKTFSGAEVVKILCREFGFSRFSQKGSHVKLRRISGDGRKITTVVPTHKELALGTLRGALELGGVEFNAFLKKSKGDN